MKWILIFATMWQGNPILEMQEFNSYDSCKAAAETIERYTYNWPGREVVWCQKK